MWDNLSSQRLCHLGIEALFGLHSVSFFHQDVHHAGVCRLCVDEHLHTHDTMEDGVQRHDEGMALHQHDETVAGLAAPLVPQDDGLGRRKHSSNFELLSLRPRAECVLLFVHSLNRAG